MPLQIRRGTEAERQTLTSLNGLVTGELLYVTNTQRLYIGTGATGEYKGVAITGYTNEDAQDAVGPMFQNGIHNGIQFVYDDVNNQVNASVSLSDYQGIIKADGFVGSVFADDSTVLIDGIQGRIVAPVFGTVTGDVTGNLTGNVTGDLTGNVTGNLTGNVTGDVKGSVVADDSTILVDGVSGRLYGNFYGNMYGTGEISINGNVTTPSIASPDNNLTINSQTNVTRDGRININSFDTIITGGGIDGTNTGSLTLRLQTSRGTALTPTSVELGDPTHVIGFSSWNGSSYSTKAAIGATIESAANGSELLPGSMQIAVRGDTGFLYYNFSSAGVLTSPGAVTVGSYAGSGAYPTTPVEGMIAFDSVTKHFVGWDGTSWKQLDN